jgi:hypothetical protein
MLYQPNDVLAALSSVFGDLTLNDQTLLRRAGPVSAAGPDAVLRIDREPADAHGYRGIGHSMIMQPKMRPRLIFRAR